MKREEAFKAMESGAVISHITWMNEKYIRSLNGDIIWPDGSNYSPRTIDGVEIKDANGWVIMGYIQPVFYRKDLKEEIARCEKYIKSLEEMGKRLANQVEELEKENERLRLENESLKAGK